MVKREIALDTMVNRMIAFDNMVKRMIFMIIYRWKKMLYIYILNNKYINKNYHYHKEQNTLNMNFVRKFKMS